MLAFFTPRGSRGGGSDGGGSDGAGSPGRRRPLTPPISENASILSAGDIPISPPPPPPGGEDALIYLVVITHNPKLNRLCYNKIVSHFR
jgi:hypothetical protein